MQSLKIAIGIIFTLNGVFNPIVSQMQNLAKCNQQPKSSYLPQNLVI